MKKIILISIFLFNLTEAKSCKNIIEAKIGSYTIERVQFYRDSQCIPNCEDMVLIDKNSNQKHKIDGFIVEGIQIHNNFDIPILQINTLAGVHTHIVSFFNIKDNQLFAIKNGVIGSDIAKPSIYIDSLSNKIIVFIHYPRYSNGCRYLMEDVFEYKDREFVQTIKGKILEKCK